MNKSTPQPDGANKISIDTAAKVVGLLTVAIVICSVTYNYGYFLVIGLPWITKLSPQDYLNTAPKTLPPLLIGFVMHIVVNGTAVHSALQRAKAGKLSSSSVRYSCYVVSVISAFVFFFGNILLEGSWRTLVLFSAVTLGFHGVMRSVVEHPRIGGKSIIVTILYIAMLLATVAVWGADEARKHLSDEKVLMTLELSEGRSLTHLFPIYFLQDGVLAQDRNCSCTTFIPQSAIKRIQIAH